MAWSFSQLHAIFLPILLSNEGQIINRTKITEFDGIFFVKSGNLIAVRF